MLAQNAFMQYKEQSINTMSKGELIITLFDAAIKNINHAIILLNNNDENLSSEKMQKAKDIFTHLSAILDRTYPISDDLYQLYTFFNLEIIKAEVKKDASVLTAILPIIEDLRNTWVQADTINHTNKNKVV